LRFAERDGIIGLEELKNLKNRCSNDLHLTKT